MHIISVIHLCVHFQGFVHTGHREFWTLVHSFNQLVNELYSCFAVVVMICAQRQR